MKKNIKRAITAEEVERIYEHARRLRDKNGLWHAYLYTVGCYAALTNTRNVLRQYWAAMRGILNGGVPTYREAVRFGNYYNMASNLINHCFGHYAWQYTLS